MNILRQINFPLKNRIVKTLYPPREERIPYYGGQMDINTDFLIDFNLYWNGGYEKNLLNFVLGFVNEDSVCLDIGANIGVYTIPLAKKTKRVIAFEPCKDFREKLESNLKISGIENVEIHGCALWDDEREMTLYYPDDGMKNKSATLFPINKELRNTEKLTTKTLDGLLDLDRLDFIKIDADGSDLKIILGGEKLIKKHLPVILYEVLDIPKLQGREAEKFLTDLGYKIRTVDKINRIATI